MDRLLDRLVRE